MPSSISRSTSACTAAWSTVRSDAKWVTIAALTPFMAFLLSWSVCVTSHRASGIERREQRVGPVIQDPVAEQLAAQRRERDPERRMAGRDVESVEAGYGPDVREPVR